MNGGGELKKLRGWRLGPVCVGQQFSEQLVHIFPMADIVDLEGLVGIIDCVDDAEPPCPVRIITDKLPLEGLVELRVSLNLFDAQFYEWF